VPLLARLPRDLGQAPNARRARYGTWLHAGNAVLLHPLRRFPRLRHGEARVCRGAYGWLCRAHLSIAIICVRAISSVRTRVSVAGDGHSLTAVRDASACVSQLPPDRILKPSFPNFSRHPRNARCFYPQHLVPSPAPDAIAHV
jgi:hypothetical protein